MWMVIAVICCLAVIAVIFVLSRGVENLEDFNIALSLMGILVEVMLLFSCLMDRHKDGDRTVLLAMMLGVSVLQLSAEAITWKYDGLAEYTGLLYVCNTLEYVSGYLLSALFTVYVSINSSHHWNSTAPYVWGVSIAAAGMIALALLSVFNGMYFTIENGVYQRGEWHWLSQALGAGIMIFDLYLILFRFHFPANQRGALVTYTILPLIASFVQIFYEGISLTYVVPAVSLIIVYVNVYTRRGIQLADQENELTKQKAAMMVSQIQPHFLYNSLTAIMDLCDRDPQMAKEAVAQFAKYLRGNMDSMKYDKPIPFEQELRHTQCYLWLEQLRFGERLQVRYQIGPTLFRIPPLTLQPLVENSVKHGITAGEMQGTVTISTQETASEYLVRVIDNGMGFSPDQPKNDGKVHIGLENVRERLRQSQGASLVINSSPGRGTEAVIIIPKTRETVLS